MAMLLSKAPLLLMLVCDAVCLDAVAMGAESTA